MAKQARITTVLLLAALSLAMWFGLINVRSTAAQAAPAGTIQDLIDGTPDGGTVNIAAGTYVESLTVNKTLTLTGVSSATTTIVAVTNQRVITVTAGHNLRLENLTLTGGQAIGSGGGGVLAAGGNVQIVNSRIVSNSAEWGGGVFQEGGSGRVDVIGSRIELNSANSQGGGLFVRGSAALTHTVVASNTTGLYGGGLHVDNGRADVLGGVFQNNRAAGSNGGGINLNNGLSLSGTQFISNAAHDQGGGVLQWNAGYTVTVINARFERNTARSKGGGASVNSTLIISNSTFVSNTVDSGNDNSTFGGGLYASGPNQIAASTFVGNSALCLNGGSCSDANGGGLYDNGGNVALTDVVFQGNEAGRMGGGLYSENSSPVLSRVIFRGNTAGWGGGFSHRVGSPWLVNVLFSGNLGGWAGGMLAENDTPTLRQVTFSGNNGYNQGGALLNYYAAPTVINSIMWGNTAMNGPEIYNASPTPVITITYSNIKFTGVYTGAGNINVDPEFVLPIAPTAAPTTTGNYHLGAGSPAINAGTNVGVAVDLDGEPRDAAPDLGADEYRTCWARLNNDTTDYGHPQAAVEASTQATDIVKIAGYCPGAQLRGGLDQAIYLSKTLTLRGGYTTTDWLTSNPIAYPTVLDALHRGRVIYAHNNGISVTLENLIMRGGLSNSGGGGLYSNGAQVTLAHVIVRDNVVVDGYGGGGLCVSSPGTLTVTASLLTGNTASYGGGIFNSGGKLVLINSTLSGNQSVTGSPSLDGGGALDQWGTAPSAIIVNSTIVSNTAVITNAARSGIWLENGTLTMQNSIVAHNGVTNNLRIENGAVFTSTGYNLTNNGAGTPFTATTDLSNTQPQLGPLQDNGGSSWTHALLPGSPAIDRIPRGVNGCGTTLTTDQRGQPRPGSFTRLCDVGAYEAQGVYVHVYLPIVIK